MDHAAFPAEAERRLVPILLIQEEARATSPVMHKVVIPNPVLLIVIQPLFTEHAAFPAEAEQRPAVLILHTREAEPAHKSVVLIFLATPRHVLLIVIADPYMVRAVQPVEPEHKLVPIQPIRAEEPVLRFHAQRRLALIIQGAPIPFPEMYLLTQTETAFKMQANCLILRELP